MDVHRKAKARAYLCLPRSTPKWNTCRPSQSLRTKAVPAEPAVPSAAPLRYHGTGGADTSKWEWATTSVCAAALCYAMLVLEQATNIHRDTMASHVGHYTRLAYFALCENEPVARVRFNCLQAMIQPCGKPPLKDDMEEPPKLRHVTTM
eukprot:Skav204388  [mRNA]  locus=scaffold2947:66806:67746:+ [translate_table: standard]